MSNNKRTVYLFLRNKKGELETKKITDFFPFYYEPDNQGEFKSYLGDSLRKIYVSNPSDVAKQRSVNAMEGDILFTKRYLIDKIDEIEKTNIKYCFIDIEIMADELPNVQRAKDPISCISAYNSLQKNIETFYLGDYAFKNEEKMIKDFIDYMKKEQFDLILGWNFVKFDYIFLYNRIKNVYKIDMAQQISPIFQTRYGDGEVPYPSGISIIDYLEWFKKVTLNREQSYALDDISQVHLKESSFEKPDFAILSLKIREKNILDIKRMVKLEEKFKLVSYFDEIRRLSKVEWEDLIWNSKIVDMLLLKEAKIQKVVLPMKPSEQRGTLKEKPDTEDKGAHRETYKKGLFENCAKYDISSAYPNMLKSFCLDSSNLSLTEINNSTKLEVCDKKQKLIGVYWFKNNPSALLPSIVDKLLVLKKDIKNQLSILDINSDRYKNTKVSYDAIKCVANSMFGTAWSRFFRLFDERVGESVPFLVRDLLYFIEKKLKEKNIEIIFIDTDGFVIDSKENFSDLLNRWGQEWANKYKKENIGIEFVFDGYFKNLFVATKCRYEGELFKLNGDIEFERKGLESRRKDSTTWMTKFLTELIRRIRYKEPKEKIINWIKKEIKNLPNQPLIDVAFPCKLARPIESYKSAPIFVRALKNTPNFKKKVGDLFYYIFVKPKENNKIKTLIKVKGNNEVSYTDILLNVDLTRKEGIEYARKEFNEPELDSKKISVLHIKNKPRDVIAFDKEHLEDIKDKVDWDMIVKRNILYKLDVIFHAMKWEKELKELIANCEYVDKREERMV